MKIDLNGTLLESDNPFVIEQWKRSGYVDIDAVQTVEAEEPKPVKKRTKKAKFAE